MPLVGNFERLELCLYNISDPEWITLLQAEASLRPPDPQPHHLQPPAGLADDDQPGQLQPAGQSSLRPPPPHLGSSA